MQEGPLVSHLYPLILSLAVPIINHGEDHQVADEGKDPGDAEAGDQVGVGGMGGIDDSHPEDTEAEDPGYGVDSAENGVAEGLDGVSQYCVHQEEEGIGVEDGDADHSR